MKLSRYSLMTLISIPSHSFQHVAQMEPRTFSFTSAGKGTRWAGGASPGCEQRLHFSSMFSPSKRRL